MSSDRNKKDDGDDDDESVSDIVSKFDKICLAFGDFDAIEIVNDCNNSDHHHQNKYVEGYDETTKNQDDYMDDDDIENSNPTTTSICYFEIQEYSKTLAYQLVWRYRPDYILVDCQGWPAAEAVATLACMRIQRPFVPVSCMELHSFDRMKTIVNMLQTKGKKYDYNNNNDNHSDNKNKPSIVAVTVCENDLDPILSVFQQANIHQILYLNQTTGALQEQLQVPSSLYNDDSEPLEQGNNITTTTSNSNSDTKNEQNQKRKHNDDLYVLFTSGTSSNQPKAVIGSHQATLRRLQWFQSTFSSCKRIGRRTKLTFVDGVTELLSSLLDHDSLLVAIPPYQLQTRGVEWLIRQTQCSQLLLLPSQLQQLLLLSKQVPSSSLQSLQPTNDDNDNKDNKDNNNNNPYICLKRVIVSGEPCSSNLFQQFRKCYPQTQFINLYGQTETTGDVTCAVLSEMDMEDAIVNDIVAVGTPITVTTTATTTKSLPNSLSSSSSLPNVIIQVRESDRQIIISGNQLSNGYLGIHNDENNNSNSNDNPFTLFETGDTGFCRNGIWYIQGRCNDVIKIDGKWTCPAEIVSAFCKFYNDVNDNNDHRNTNNNNNNSENENKVKGSEAQEETNVIMLDVVATFVEGQAYVLCNDATICQQFSREQLHSSGGIPWNLIPQAAIYCPEIPKNTNTISGAGKMDRSAIMEIARQYRQGNYNSSFSWSSSLRKKRPEEDEGGGGQQQPHSPKEHSPTTSTSTSTSHHRILSRPNTFVSCAARALGFDDDDYANQIDMKKSFVELGGDSGKSITFLYLLMQLRRNENNQSSSSCSSSNNNRTIDFHDGGGLTTTDILMAESLNEIQCIFNGEVPRKKRRTATTSTTTVMVEKPFVPMTTMMTAWDANEIHKSIDLKACVDATPLHVGDNIYAACQGGVILKVGIVEIPTGGFSGNVLGYYHLRNNGNGGGGGWMIQANLISFKDCIIVCAYSRGENSTDTGKGMIASLSKDLNQEFWRVSFDKPIKTTPIIFKECIWVVTGGTTINKIDALTGEEHAGDKIELPEEVTTKPVILQKKDGTVNFVYAGSSWESCLMVVHEDRHVSKHLEYIIGPVHKEMTTMSIQGNNNQQQHPDIVIIIADSYGALHYIDAETMEVSTTQKLSNHPLAAPLAIYGGINGRVIVGCYDGTVFCVQNQKVVLWECKCRASIYTKVAYYCYDEDDGGKNEAITNKRFDGYTSPYVIVVTTAGDIVKIEEETGKITWQYIVNAEIWSNPITVTKSLIAFGARDSRLHFVASKK